MRMKLSTSMNELQNTARTLEAVRRQSKSMSSESANVHGISRKPAHIQSKGRGKRDQQFKPKERKEEQKSGVTYWRYRCGREGHFARNPNCPAMNKTCNNCKQTGHFASVFKTKKVQDKGKVNFVESDEEEDAFSAKSKHEFEKVEVTVGGQKILMIADSGSSANIIEGDED
ncbi:uncharacterized protein LOC110237280 [Exaiptasia diaphana]|uniref:CCHC-type domain-containing protein n=1 Tax=Exaiptasia diaphana TaxID=2652724 RepID=A0A913X401_EXADI|nr:uncharacterized protein LOC110237280 [Exaiptasia diaphana]